MKPIKVALSGSGFRLPAHVGALAAIEDQGYTITEICGTSGGAIVAAIYACGMSVKDMRALAMTYDWAKVMRLELWKGLRKGAYCSGNDLLNFLYKHTGSKQFGSLKTNLKIIASDLHSEREVCFSFATQPKMPVALAARASASIPFVYLPVQYKDLMLVDGGVTNNIPVSHLSAGGQRIGVYLVSNDSPINGDMDVTQIAGRTIDLMLASAEDAHADEAGDARIVRVPTSYAGSLDTKMPEYIRLKLYNDGYTAVSRDLKNADIASCRSRPVH